MRNDTYYPHNVSDFCSPFIGQINSEEYSKKIEELTELGITSKYPKNQIIVNFNDSVTGVYLLTKGKASARIMSPEGNEKIIFMFKPNCLLAELPFLNRVESNIEIIVHAGSILTYFDNETFNYLRETNSFFNEQLLQAILRKGQIIIDQLLDVCYLSPEQRIIKLMVYLCKENQKSEGANVILNITQDEISQFVGLHRITVARVYSKLKALGVIKNVPNSKKTLNIYVDRLMNLN